MIGKLIILALVAVLIYALYIRLKSRFMDTPDSASNSRQNDLKNISTIPSKKKFLGGDVRISKIQLIICGLVFLYFIWGLITLYR